MTILALLDRASLVVRSSYDEDRRRNPHRYLYGPDGSGGAFLFVENVARMLGCGADFVRRIPREELPASRVGQRVLYAREDVESYVRSKRVGSTTRRCVRRLSLQRVAKSGRKTVDCSEVSSTFDPVGKVTALLAGKKSDAAS
jgi:excisionase family DNA binding protein